MKRSRLLLSTLLLCALLLMLCLPAFAAARGHAVYRALNSVGGATFGHGGVVSAVSGGAPTYVIHAPGNTVSPYTVTEVTISTFKGDGLDYYGTYCMPGTSTATYSNILVLAELLDDYNVPYVFTHQMDHEHVGSAGSILPKEITYIRCDGVIEYCYEYYDVELLGRTVNGLYYWDISNPLDYIYHASVTFTPQTQRALMTPS